MTPNNLPIRSKMISRITAMSCLILFIYVFSVDSCGRKTQTDEKIQDMWINHSPRELSERFFRESQNRIAITYDEMSCYIPEDSVIDIGAMTSDTIWWPLFVIIDKGMPYEFKDACDRYGTPFVSEFTLSFNKNRENDGIFNIETYDGIYGIYDFDEEFADIIYRFLTVDDSLWQVKWCFWSVGNNCYEAFYRKMGPDSLRIISGNLHAPNNVE